MPLRPPFTVSFIEELAHGTAVGVELPEAALADDPLLRAEFIARLKHEEERTFASTLGPRRVVSWIGGRIALHKACSIADVPVGAILATKRGAPALPERVTGSISHKEGIAVALLAPKETACIGVDVEEIAPRKYDVARVILTDHEQLEIAHLNDVERGREVLVRFSIKEAIYKAIDPFVGRYVDFKEVEVRPRADGTASVTMNLEKGEGPFAIDLTWSLRTSYVLTTARASIGGRYTA